ncbi:MAG: methionine adenosyltransferase [Bacillota bacterium]
MMTHKRLFTSESVTEGHPDKICDQISDAILDAILKDDRNARVAVETAATTGLILVMGEITTETYVDIQKIVRETVKEIGYDRGKYGFDAENLGVLVAIDPQSPDIAQGVNQDDNLGAGDQGIMFGYATDETEEYMPITHMYAQKLALQLSRARKEKTIPALRPDGKTQITIEFNDDGTPKRVDNIIVSSQHAPNIKQDALHAAIKEHVIEPIIPTNLIDEETRYYINPTGKFVVGGPHGDAGLTGRKVIVDTYGGVAHHGGGAFSGKDPSKVDRSASYMARYVAKNLVAAGIAKELELQVAYAIGVVEPTSIHVDTFGTSEHSDETIRKVVDKVFDLTPKGIIETLDLDRPIYRQVAAYGHFGRSDLDLPWEKTDKVNAIKTALASLK